MRTRAILTKELERLQQDVIHMGRICEEMLEASMKALLHNNMEMVKKVVALDDEVDTYNLSIEEKCIELIALQQPMASDLRTIAAAMKIITDIERCGDYSEDIAKTSLQLQRARLKGIIQEIAKMAAVVMDMMRQSIESYVQKDLIKVEKMIEQDDIVDHLYRTLHELLVEEVEKDSSLAAEAFHLLLILRYLERIADHLTNVGERVYFMVTGTLKELHQ